jgi:hypothetical protein
MTPDVSTGDPTQLLCLNCARRIVSPRSVSKYGGLAGYLKFRAAFTDSVKLNFARIDGIIGDNLPMDAYKTEQWWANAPSNVHVKAWLEAGWETQEVNLKEGYVIFKKVRDVQPRSTRGKKRDNQIKKPFTPVRVRPPKPKMPSKTKVSKLYARIKNLERQRTSTPSYHGSFKPKPKHEKRLFKPDEKPG